MNPNYNEQPDLSLPPPQPGAEAPQWQAPAPVSPEMGPAAQQMPTLAPPPQPAAPQPTNLGPTPLGGSAVPAGSSMVASPAAADDNDLIEKEWVEKAKAIVAGTRDDPFVQSREVSRFKADYIKKRYNKDIKLPED